MEKVGRVGGRRRITFDRGILLGGVRDMRYAQQSAVWDGSGLEG